VSFSLGISSNKFRENPTYEHLYFSGGLPIPLKKGLNRSSFKVKSMRWDGFWFYLIIDSGNPQKMIG